MKVKFSGYKEWKRISDELGVSRLHILPTITITQDNGFDMFEFPTIVEFVWLFLECNIYLGIPQMVNDAKE